uniref:Glutathione S-transferase omega n=1 Tax=Brachionus plicatilis TaxID=10195 RepID=A0A3G2JSF5_BRAPC|nr:glutathione S-transferase O2 [Brachionus plicatilis]
MSKELAYSIGSTFPPLTPGIARLYSMRFCPYSHRVRLVLAEKNIPHEIVNINPKKRPEWYSDIHPAGLIPCLQFDDGRIVYESVITTEYLDAVYAEKKLISSDPYERARQQMLVDSFQRIVALLFKALKFKDPEAFNEICKVLDHYEKVLSDTFFGGKDVGFTDLMIWPWFERIRSLKSLLNNELDKERFPKLTTWIKNMTLLDSVKKTSVRQDHLIVFTKQSTTSAEPDYDIGLEKPKEEEPAPAEEPQSNPE